MHYYQFNIGDYIRETAHLSVDEDCAYRRIIDLYYESELPIPNETKAVCRRIRMSDSEETIISVLNEFFHLNDDDCWHHTRCDKEITAYKAKAETARVNGSKGGRPKKPTKTQSVNSGNLEKTEPKANHKPLTTNQEPKDLVEKKLLDILNSKSGKKFKPVESNLKFLRARLKEGHTEQDIIDVIERKILEWQNDPEMKQYIRPATLFNAEKFNQYIGEIGSPLPENKKTKQPWEIIPREDDKLWGWAKKHNYSNPGSLDYYQYRSKLNIEVEIRQNQERNRGNL